MDKPLERCRYPGSILRGSAYVVRGRPVSSVLSAIEEVFPARGALDEDLAFPCDQLCCRAGSPGCFLGGALSDDPFSTGVGTVQIQEVGIWVQATFTNISSNFINKEGDRLRVM